MEKESQKLALIFLYSFFYKKLYLLKYLVNLHKYNCDVY